MEPQELHEESSPVPGEADGLGRDERCPLCGGDNECRVAKGHLYKGPCWCHQIIVPNPILTRLAEDSIDPACLCRPCLETIAQISREANGTEEIVAEVRKVILTNRLEAKDPEPDFYLDEQGDTVFTAAYHLKRGTCCQNRCRHCPY
jgi:hypothetical protein